ncbi:MAG: T9SS type A sorting domain-containing protein, partial [Bacteroidetes bacterium]
LGLFYPSLAGAGIHTMTYTYTGNNGCTISKTGKLTVNPLPEKPIITIQDTALISSADYGNQWYYEGNKITGAIDKQYTPHKYGRYKVQITDSNGCKSKFSEDYNYTTSVPEELNNDLIKIYPNPTESQLNIEIITSEYPTVDYTLYNVLGETILNSRIYLNGTKTIEVLNLKNKPSGIYLLTIKLCKNLYYRKIIVSH